MLRVVCRSTTRVATIWFACPGFASLASPDSLAACQRWPIRLPPPFSSLPAVCVAVRAASSSRMRSQSLFSILGQRLVCSMPLVQWSVVYLLATCWWCSERRDERDARCVLDPRMRECVTVLRVCECVCERRVCVLT